LNVDLYAQAETLPLRRDMVRLLIYLRGHKIKGIQIRGNLPRRAIWEVTSQLTNLPVLEETFGKQPYKAQKDNGCPSTAIPVYPIQRGRSSNRCTEPFTANHQAGRTVYQEITTGPDLVI